MLCKFCGDKGCMYCPPGGSRVVVLAGRRYREHLVNPMRERGYVGEGPMEGMGIGQQMAWLEEEVHGN